MLTLYFVDSVTGVIVNGDVRHRASDPVHLIHSENWIVLMYFNDKARRTEVVTYELYEGKTQKNSTGRLNYLQVMINFEYFLMARFLYQRFHLCKPKTRGQ